MRRAQHQHAHAPDRDAGEVHAQGAGGAAAVEQVGVDGVGNQGEEALDPGGVGIEGREAAGGGESGQAHGV